MTRLSSLVLALGFLLLIPGTAFPEPVSEFETLTDVEARWAPQRKGLSELTRAERLALARDFFLTISWEQIRHYCGEAYANAGPDQTSILAGLVDGKLRSQGPDPEAMAAIIGNPEANADCQGTLVKFIFTHRDSIAATPGGAIMAQAFLDLADSGTRNQGVINDLERGAACLWAGDPILERGLRYTRDEDENRALQGVAILGESCDSRAPDSLMGIVRELQAGKRHPRALSLALSSLSLRTELPYFELYHSLFHEARMDSLSIVRRSSLAAMARCGDPRAYAVLLREYDDGVSGIVDATHTFEDRRLKSKYWGLWYLVRLAEEGMILVLREDGPQADEALELLDRASRFGLPATRDRIIHALENWSQNEDQAVQDRVKGIIVRFRSYPEPMTTQ